jgi:hypothetical protein
MKEITFKKSDVVRVIAEVASYIDSLQDDKEYKLEIKERKEKRSLSANNYFWVMADKLAEKLRIPKTEIYRSYIKEIGGNNDVVCCINKAVPALCEAWSARGIGWLAELEDSKIDGCTNIRLYYGSSTYDKAQMSRLIELAKQDCIENDIPTWDEEELQRLCDEWGQE